MDALAYVYRLALKVAVVAVERVVLAVAARHAEGNAVILVLLDVQEIAKVVAMVVAPMDALGHAEAVGVTVDKPTLATSVAPAPVSLIAKMIATLLVATRAIVLVEEDAVADVAPHVAPVLAALMDVVQDALQLVLDVQDVRNHVKRPQQE